MQDVDLNWIAIIVAAIVPMVLGVLWYSPVLFAQLWLRAVGRTEEELSGAPLGYLLSAVSALLSAYVLARIVKWAEVDDLCNGTLVGIFVWMMCGHAASPAARKARSIAGRSSVRARRTTIRCQAAPASARRGATSGAL